MSYGRNSAKMLKAGPAGRRAFACARAITLTVTLTTPGSGRA
mgnify:CR=1 FL=1